MQTTLILETRRAAYWRNENGAGEVWYSTRAGSLAGYGELGALLKLKGEPLSTYLKVTARNAALARSPVE